MVMAAHLQLHRRRMAIPSDCSAPKSQIGTVKTEIQNTVNNMKKKYFVPEVEITVILLEDHFLDASLNNTSGENLNSQKNTYSSWNWSDEE